VVKTITRSVIEEKTSESIKRTMEDKLNSEVVDKQIEQLFGSTLEKVLETRIKSALKRLSS
jgi:ribosomal protein S3AE